MPYNSETEKFYQAPSTIVDSTPDGDTVREGFDDRLTPAMTEVYADFNLLKTDGMIGIGIPATTSARGIGRVATRDDAAPGSSVGNGPAFLSAERFKITGNPTPDATPRAGADGKIAFGWIPHGTPVGDIRLLPFRVGEGPSGWYYCNGDRFPLNSPQGEVLRSLPENFKWDWRIQITGDLFINLPRLFYDDGRGLTIRTADCRTRFPGSMESDALQGHWHERLYGIWTNDGHGGTWAGGFTTKDWPLSGYGELATGHDNGYKNWIPRTGNAISGDCGSLRVAWETRALNVAMTPFIFLGV